MKLYDISRSFFQAKVYPGDPAPRMELIRRMEIGDTCNLSAVYAGAHTATHVDAPRHFVQDGVTIEALPLEPFYGPCSLITVDGLITGEDIDAMLRYAQKRVLFRGEGKAFLTQSAAFALADAGVLLVGTDALSIGAYGDEEEPHQELLSAGVPLLEGLDFSCVPKDGEYTLCAFPVKLNGMEGAPARAVLIEE